MESLNIQIPNRNIDVFHKLDRDYSAKMHIHNNYELYFSLSNNNKFFVNNKLYNCDKYDVFLFDNTDLHKISVSETDAYERYVISFSCDTIDKFSPDCKKLLTCFDKRQPQHSHKISLAQPDAEKLIVLMDKMIDVFRSDNVYKNERLHIALLEMLIFVNEKKLAKRIGRRDTPASPNGSKSMSEILYYIEQNFDSTLQLETIARTFFYNKYHLCRVFKIETGFHIGEYIQSCRLAHAVTFLQKSFTVSEVAMKCGFGSDTYFISVFKKAIGMTPKQYALQYLSNH